MHHSLRLYAKNREFLLRYYIFQAKWTKLPLIGRIVRAVANAYGQKGSRAYLLTLEEACDIVDSAPGLALGPCTCRHVFNNCDKSKDAEIMLGPTRNIFAQQRPHDYRDITPEEAKHILRQCHEDGLIHTIIKYRQDFYALCNCRTCCCVPMRLKKAYGIGNALARREDIVQRFKEQQL